MWHLRRHRPTTDRHGNQQLSHWHVFWILLYPNNDWPSWCTAKDNEKFKHKDWWLEMGNSFSVVSWNDSNDTRFDIFHGPRNFQIECKHHYRFLFLPQAYHEHFLFKEWNKLLNVRRSFDLFKFQMRNKKERRQNTTSFT